LVSSPCAAWGTGYGYVEPRLGWMTMHGAVHGSAVEVAVRVPPERAFLLGEDDPVGEVGTGRAGWGTA
jgi:hypothetical protein